MTDNEGKKYLKDIFEGKVEMQYVEEQKSFGRNSYQKYENIIRIFKKNLKKAFGILGR